MKTQEERVRRILIFTICLYSLYLRALALMKRELWNDEVFALSFMTGPFKPFWRSINYFVSGDHSAFPGEYLLNYPFVQLFGFDKWGIAIPHIAMTVLGFYFLYKVCQIYLATTFGFTLAFLIVCFNSNLIFHAFEFRPYAVIPTLALGSLYFADMIICRRKNFSPIERLGFVYFYFVVVNYQAYGILIFILPVIYTILINRHVPWKELFSQDYIRFFLIIFFISFPVWCWYASANHFGIAPKAVEQWQANPFKFIPSPLVHPFGFFKTVVANLIGHKPFYLILVGCIGVFFVSRKERFQQFLFLILLIIVPISLILYVDMRSNYWFIQRQFVWVMPFFALLLGWQGETCIQIIRQRISRPHHK